MKTGQRKGRSKVNFFYAKLGLFFFLHSCLCDRYKSAEGWRIGAENVRLVNKNINNFRDSNSTGVNEKPCKYFQIDKSLHCKGLIDFQYFDQVKEKPISNIIIEDYEVAWEYNEKYLSKYKQNTGEWYMKLPNIYQKLTGEVQLKDTALIVNLIASLNPSPFSANNFKINGELFSSTPLKISRSFKGELKLSFVNKKTVVSIEIKTNDEKENWVLDTKLKFQQRNNETNLDEWEVRGVIDSKYVSENEFTFFFGHLDTKLMKGECSFSGEVNLYVANMLWDLSGSVSSPLEKPITIHRGAFSDMLVENITFKNCNFFNDFDKDVFEGLQGVRTITFVGSKLEVMPKLSELLKSFTELEEIYIEDSSTPHLKFGTVAVLEKVQVLSFKGSGLLNIDDISFMWLKNSNLTYLNFKDSHVALASEASSVLKWVNRTLLNLDISYSTLKTEKDLKTILRHLKIIFLAADGLHMKKIPTEALSHVKDTLEYLSLSESSFGKVLENNLFHTIFNFPYMPRLRELNLMDCKINFLERGAFDNLPNLKTLHLGYNNIENLQDGWISIKPQILHLDLKYNGIKPKSLYQTNNKKGTAINLSVFEELVALDLSNGIFDNVELVIQSLGNSVQNLFIRNIGLENLQSNLFENLTNLEVIDMSLNKNLKTFPINLFKNLKKLKVLILKQCRINSASDHHNEIGGGTQSTNNVIENLRYLDLSYNIIKTLDSDMLSIFPKLEILNLSGNDITTWRTTVFEFNSFFKGLFLDDNKIESISADMMSDIKKLKFLKLGHNPFKCGPYVYDILQIVDSFKNSLNGIYLQNQKRISNFIFNPEFNTFKNIPHSAYSPNRNNFEALNDLIKENSRNDVPDIKVDILDWSESNYACYSTTKDKIISFTLVNETFDDMLRPNFNYIVLMWLPIAAVIGVVITLGMICWKVLDIHLITKAVRNAVALTFLSSGNKEPEKYNYNVFLSYSDRDREWVIENLLPRLESYGDVKVCLHERDFQVGLSILENIIGSIDSSRNIILVLSKAFLKSQWCQYEMHLAQHRLLEKGRDQLILILLENIPLVKRPKTLRYLMMTKTYIEWPGNTKSPKEIELFWSRLFKALNTK